MDKIHLKSPAKVNLTLKIFSRRKDGYHDIETILQKIDLCDSLKFSLKRKKGIDIATNHPLVPKGEKNLIYRAAKSIFEKIDYRGGLQISIIKKIPIGAGLGGGSSNAATTLLALNCLLNLNLPQKLLSEMGLEIGTDVPFFLFHGDALAKGRGEKLEKISLPKLWYLLVYPNFEVSTRWAYQNFVLTKKKFHFNNQWLFQSPEDISKILWNDLESIVAKRYPVINTMKEILYSVGALGSLMSGSGPTVFGIFQEEFDLLEAYKKITKMVRGKGWRVIKAQSLN